MEPIDKITGYLEELVALRHDLHAHPELGFEEVRTAGIVAERLRAWGIEVIEGVGKTGVVGILHGAKSGRRIGLRADMDALPMEEATNLTYRSKYPGRFHGCGHDGHTTMLLGAARYLAETRRFDGTIILVFQPAEEGLGGARAMISEGLFERFPCDEIYAIHNAPHLPEGVFSLCPGAAMAAGDFFDIQITGRGSHAAMPEQGADPIVASAALIMALQTVVSRNVAPVKTAVVSVTRTTAGSAYNVIPDTAHLSGTLRSLDDKVRALLRQRVEVIAGAIGEAHAVEIQTVFRNVFNVLHNHEQQSAAFAAVARELLGDENVDSTAKPVMGSEDFADMLLQVPGAYVFLGQKSTAPLHNPSYVFDDRIIPKGAALLARIAETRCSEIIAPG